MNELEAEIATFAARAVEACESRGGGFLDYSEASLEIVESMLAEVAEYAQQLSPDQVSIVVHEFGCYVLEVGRKEFGGCYQWHDGREQPVLVVGEPAFRIAMLAWDKVRGRIGGDTGDNIPFHYSGFAERARKAKAGDDAIYV